MFVCLFVEVRFLFVCVFPFAVLVAVVVFDAVLCYFLVVCVVSVCLSLSSVLFCSVAFRFVLLCFVSFCVAVPFTLRGCC